MQQIIIYSMDSCPFCIKAKELLKHEIDMGLVVEKKATAAPKGVTGFPHFESKKTNKSHTGLPSSKADLFHSLGHNSENFEFKPKSIPVWVWIVLALVLLSGIVFGCVEIFKKKKSTLAPNLTNAFSYTSLNRSNNFM
tara:strand:- start:687 stop:1100 length:414 start_codon:yes stop_codon:yes gene_type:complete